MYSINRAVRTTVVGVIVSLAAGAAQAQSTGKFNASLGAGVSPYDLAGTGTGFVAAARLDYEILKPVSVEGGLGYFRYEPQGNTGWVGMVMPEVSVFAGPQFGRFRPYLGGGVGFASTVQGPRETDLTLHVGAGTQVRIVNAWAARGEFRARSVKPWTGSMADLTIGLSRRI